MNILLSIILMATGLCLVVGARKTIGILLILLSFLLLSLCTAKPYPTVIF